MLVLITLSFFIVLCFKWLLKPEPAPVFSIYSQPGRFYYIKYICFYLLFSLRKVRLNSSLSLKRLCSPLVS